MAFLIQHLTGFSFLVWGRIVTINRGDTPGMVNSGRITTEQLPVRKSEGGKELDERFELFI
jgi:hypothetical protein